MLFAGVNNQPCPEGRPAAPPPEAASRERTLATSPTEAAIHSSDCPAELTRGGMTPAVAAGFGWDGGGMIPAALSRSRGDLACRQRQSTEDRISSAGRGRGAVASVLAHLTSAQARPGGGEKDQLVLVHTYSACTPTLSYFGAYGCSLAVACSKTLRLKPCACMHHQSSTPASRFRPASLRSCPSCLPFCASCCSQH